MKTRSLLLLLALMVLSAGCRAATTKPITTLSGSIPESVTQVNFTAKDMHEAIIKGCLDKGWNARDSDVTTIEATIEVRGKHIVVVSIPYTATSYTINYKSSVNMDYNNTRDDGLVTIHYNYNKWITNLDRAIKANIAHGK
jgi:hypothetical protein